jgi:hypothetical protein
MDEWAGQALCMCDNSASCTFIYQKGIIHIAGGDLFVVLKIDRLFMFIRYTELIHC